MRTCLIIKNFDIADVHDNDSNARNVYDYDDDLKAMHFWKNKILHDSDHTFSKILTFHQLKTSYKTFEARNRLASSYDLFIADHRIIQYFSRILGSAFVKRKKWPMGIKLNDNTNLKTELDNAFRKTYCEIRGSGSCCELIFGHTSMPVNQIFLNLKKVIKTLDIKIPGMWKNIRSLYLKCRLGSPSIPIYVDLTYSDLEIPRIKQPKLETDNFEEITTLPDNVKVRVLPSGRIQFRNDKNNAIVSHKSKKKMNPNKSKSNKRPDLFEIRSDTHNIVIVESEKTEVKAEEITNLADDEPAKILLEPIKDINKPIKDLEIIISSHDRNKRYWQEESNSKLRSIRNTDITPKKIKGSFTPQSMATSSSFTNESAKLRNDKSFKSPKIDRSLNNMASNKNTLNNKNESSLNNIITGEKPLADKTIQIILTPIVNDNRNPQQEETPHDLRPEINTSIANSQKVSRSKQTNKKLRFSNSKNDDVDVRVLRKRNADDRRDNNDEISSVTPRATKKTSLKEMLTKTSCKIAGSFISLNHIQGIPAKILKTPKTSAIISNSNRENATPMVKLNKLVTKLDSEVIKLGSASASSNFICKIPPTIPKNLKKIKAPLKILSDTKCVSTPSVKNRKKLLTTEVTKPKLASLSPDLIEDIFNKISDFKNKVTPSVKKEILLTKLQSEVSKPISHLIKGTSDKAFKASKKSDAKNKSILYVKQKKLQTKLVNVTKPRIGDTKANLSDVLTRTSRRNKRHKIV
ncbi:unnamed protein product [Gordionus sp. m RMFG-2023]